MDKKEVKIVTGMNREQERTREEIEAKVFQKLRSPNIITVSKYASIGGNFKRAKTNEERMQVSARYYALLGGKHNYIDQRFNEVKNKENFKDKEKSNMLRAEGNTAYQNGDNMKALELYTKSVAYAPFDSPELALAYANRSAVLRTLGMCHDCIDDIQRALNHGYPTKKSFKLLLREAQCYRDLSVEEEAQISFDKASKLLQFLPEDLRSGLEIHLEKEKKVRKDVNTTVIIYPDETPELSYGPSSETPCASSAVRIEYSEQQGRHLVATRDIKIGDVLIFEENLVATLATDRQFDHCDYCHKLCHNLLPCSNCTWVMFCSEQCRVEANKKYHIAECAARSRFLHFSGQFERDATFERVIRILAMIGISNLKPYLKYARMNQAQEFKKLSNEEKRTRGFNSQGVFDSSDFNIIFNMISHIEDHDVDTLLPSSVFTLQIPKCFGVSMERNPDYFAIAGLCLQLRDSYCFSSIYRCYRNFKLGLTSSPVITAHCVQPLVSLLNHSCNPNTRSLEYGNKKGFVAFWPISKGNIITDGYKNLLHSRRKERQDYLRKRWLFDCKCEVCVNNLCLIQQGIITDYRDIALALSFLMENAVGEVMSTSQCGRMGVPREMLQKRFDFLTRMWEKKQYMDALCWRIQAQLLTLRSLQGNRVV